MLCVLKLFEFYEFNIFYIEKAIKIMLFKLL